MLNGQKIVVVMPAYNAARKLRQTYTEVMAQGIVDLVIVVDDASQDARQKELSQRRSHEARRISRLLRPATAAWRRADRPSKGACNGATLPRSRVRQSLARTRPKDRTL